ncbi:MAG: 50S ribosomal protein L9 [Candidatus Spechtbacteria bacterium RIFCSPLOWO2_01_FULL_43_12]|uniref:Large ribosomal subunit protein bL9 n=1 Tax=Candidatus Spechtbacteria bacterium RIFCSPLOWO2_01_FULL_43_12 TaxID=1802162 RepID=A0A1G2HFA8_9BACT|nr:MAG: 50S ribosomal protein L9 [Candidatus Spechtbacteria bacterium RIFCSPLOWO2_01_FULL_43_12]
MKIILLEDIKNLGKKWEIKKVSDGYARNFLIPKGLVKPATKDELDKLGVMFGKKEEEATVELQKIEDTVASLDGYELMMKEKASDEGKLYSSITSDKISKSLKKEGFNVSSKFIKLDSPIKQTGEYEIVLEFDHGLEAGLKLIVEGE